MKLTKSEYDTLVDGIVDIVQNCSFDGCNSSQAENSAKHLIKSLTRHIQCDCVIPKPIDPYDDVDKHICRDCNGEIESV